MTTHYVQIVHAQRAYDPDDWTPWIDCKGSTRDTAMLAAHTFLREAGYASGSTEWEPFEFSVYVCDDKTPRHPNGRPVVCSGFTLTASPVSEVL